MGRLDRTTISYILALGLIGILAIGTHVMVDTVVERMESGAEVVNLSGRQRMLSQRIAGFAQRLSDESSEESGADIAPKMRRAVDLMDQSHQALIGRLNGDSALDSADVRAIYFSMPHRLDQRVRGFVEQARRYLALPPSDRSGSELLALIEEAAEQPLLHSLDQAVQQYQIDSETRVRDLRRVLFVMLGLMLLALVAEAIWIFRPLIRRLVEANRDLNGALTEVEDRRSQVSLLLDNSGQGFFSFGSNLRVDAEASQACRILLGRAPDGESAEILLFPDQPETQELFRSVMATVFAEGDPDRAEMMLSLLPERLDIGDFVLRLECRLIAAAKVMVVLTDLTEEAALSEKIVLERKQSEMIVAAVVERNDFALAIEEFRTFVDFVQDASDSEAFDAATLDTIFRRAHTCKGVLSQFGFPAAAQALHDVEDSLVTARTRLKDLDTDAKSEPEIVTAAMDALDVEHLIARFESDLSIVSDALGPEFIAFGGATAIPPDMVHALANLADRLLKREPLDLTDNAVTDLLARTSRLAKVSLAGVLRGYDRIVQDLAIGSEKHAEPVTVSGPDIWVDLERYGGFLRSLVHVFRNTVAHGIETVEERQEVGKPEAGRIVCALALKDETIRISISDDGRGIDIASMRERLGEALTETWSDDQVIAGIFEDGVSTTVEVDTTSGRGVGLPAVKEMVIELGGKIGVETSIGKGTTFLIELPVSSDMIVDHAEPPSGE